jgi:hypothetical protein
MSCGRVHNKKYQHVPAFCVAALCFLLVARTQVYTVKPACVFLLVLTILPHVTATTTVMLQQPDH